MSDENTLFLRLAGPMQSWGTSSRFQLRRTDNYPSKSGVLGLLLCAAGVRREDSAKANEPLARLVMGVRVDRPGTLDWDYHTAGARMGIRSADGKIKKTASTGEYETLLSRRQYLFDAAFLVALQGSAETLSRCEENLKHPVWPLFLGRKCCVPAEPVLVGRGNYDNLVDALSSLPWYPRIEAIDDDSGDSSRTLSTFIEHQPETPPPSSARLVHDVPRTFGYHGHGARCVVPDQVTVAVATATQNLRARRDVPPDPYGPEWKVLRRVRLAMDKGLCVFCKAEAEDVHHLDYSDVRPETLRSLCNLCHDACTMLEYGQELTARRVDPIDPSERPVILKQIRRLMNERRLGRRRELLEAARIVATSFVFEDGSSTSREKS